MSTKDSSSRDSYHIEAGSNNDDSGTTSSQGVISQGVISQGVIKPRNNRGKKKADSQAICCICNQETTIVQCNKGYHITCLVNERQTYNQQKSIIDTTEVDRLKAELANATCLLDHAKAEIHDLHVIKDTLQEIIYGAIYKQDS